MQLPKTHRRNFIQATTAAAVVAPYFWTSSQTKAEDKNSKLNVASIGVGGRGTSIGTQASALGNMIACADVHAGNANRFASRVAKEHGAKCAVYDDYRRILDRDDIDVITCATPDHWHTRIAIDAMHAGKDVYCEKPLTLTIGESKTITAATKATGKIFQVGTQQRSENRKRFLKAVAIARSGRLGEKLHATSSVGKATADGPFQIEPAPPELDFEFWLGQAPKVEFCPNRIGWNFRWWLEYSGGQVTDWGVHHTDIALWALGGEQEGVREAEGRGSFPGIPEDVSIADFLNGKINLLPRYNVAHEFDCDLTLHNGNTINLTSGKNELILAGENGRIRVNRGGLTGRPVEEIQADRSAREKLDQEVAKLYRGMPMRGHMANFFHCVKERITPISDVWTHCNSVNACHIANIAMFVRRPIKFDPTSYQFVGDEEANAFINRTQRAPWKITA